MTGLNGFQFEICKTYKIIKSFSTFSFDTSKSVLAVRTIESIFLIDDKQLSLCDL